MGNQKREKRERDNPPDKQQQREQDKPREKQQKREPQDLREFVRDRGYELESLNLRKQTGPREWKRMVLPIDGTVKVKAGGASSPFEILLFRKRANWRFPSRRWWLTQGVVIATTFYLGRLSAFLQ